MTRPVLVLLAGWGMPPPVWDAIRPGLASLAEIHAPDWMADLERHSEAAPDETLTQVARQLAERMPENAIWLGWSLGGAVATAVAAQEAAGVRAVLHVAHRPRFLRDESRDGGMSPDLFTGFRAAFREDPCAAWKRFQGLVCQGAPTFRQDLRRLQALCGENPPVSTAALSRGLDLLEFADQRAALDTLRCPRYILQGDRDSLTPPAMIRPDHALSTVLPHAAHAPFISHPEEFLAWLSRTLSLLP